MKKITNIQVAGIFQTIANLLEIKGEVVYKTIAYRRVAENLVELGRDINLIHQAGKLQEIPGVGKAIAEKIGELLETGEITFYNKLIAEVPATLVDLLEIQGLGKKKVAMLWKTLGITNLQELEASARSGKLRELPGMGEKSETKILQGIDALSRRTGRIPLGVALPFADKLLEMLRRIPGVTRAELGGSARRMRETVGDLDILAAAVDSTAAMDAFVSHPGVIEVIGKGTTKSSVEFDIGLRVQLWVHSPESFGTALQYATGSKDHNVRLREIALSRGYSLSERTLKKENGNSQFFSNEKELYKALGLPWVPPEIREDRGEIQSAKNNTLPELVEMKHIRADLHTHSTWSDGKASIREMATGAIERGIKVLAITDHSQSLGIANGLSIEALRKQRKEIDDIQAEFSDQILLLQGSEVEIRADGELDYPDEFLAELDIVVASLHVSLRQPRAKVTRRLLNAIQNPHVDIIGHLTGRLIPNREGADLDMEAILSAAAESGVSLEINANPQRLDLNDIYTRRAIGMGIPISINTDAHRVEGFEFMSYGVSVARRGWAHPEDIINTWEPGRIAAWLRSRGRS